MSIHFTETWRDVRDYEKAYEVSSLGAVRSKTRTCSRLYHNSVVRKGKPLIPVPLRRGYLRVGLRYGGKRGMYLIHRLVWEAFRGKIPEHLLINHKNGNKNDNRLSNLELMTNLENMRHAVTNGLLRPARGERQGSAKLVEKQVLEIRRLYATGTVTLLSLAEKYGVDFTNISMIVRRRTWRHV